MRPLLGFVAVAAGLVVTCQGASAFTIINQNNAASGGARVMLADPNGVAALSRDGTVPQTPSLGVTGGLNRGPGYGGMGIFDYANGSTAHDNFPTFPGENNHLTPGTNAGMLNYGAIPGRDSWR